MIQFLLPHISVVAIPITILVPELHPVGSHSHGISMGKWEAGIPIPDADLYS